MPKPTPYEFADDTPNHIPYLLFTVILTIVLWQFPIGQLILYPFTILAIWFHEMAHGLTAIITGGYFSHMDILLSGAGAAYHAPNPALGNVGKAIVAAAGPIGPAIGGAVFILAGQRKQLSSILLGFLGSFMVFSWIFWGLFSFGMLCIAVMGGIILYATLRYRPDTHILIVHFIGVQSIISVFRQIDYLFKDTVVLGGRVLVTDTGVIARSIGLRYDAWGLMLMVSTIGILIFTFWYMHHRHKKQQELLMPPI